MSILQEIHEAMNDYERLHYIPPNLIYVARNTYNDFMSAVETRLVAAKVDIPYKHAEETIFGLKIKISKTIKDGFVVVNEF